MVEVAEKKHADKEFRWSVRRKTDAVMRLLRGEDLDVVAVSFGSRPIAWPPGETSSWPPDKRD